MTYFEMGQAASELLPEASVVNFSNDPGEMARATYASSGFQGLGRYRRRGVGELLSVDSLKAAAPALALGFAIGYYLAKRNRSSAGAFSPFNSAASASMFL